MPDDSTGPVQFPPFDPERVDAAFAEYARDDATKCKECGGSGLKTIMRITDTCPFCKGSGRIAPAPDAPAAREGVQITLSADDITALRFCVDTANYCIRHHQPTAYAATMGRLARAYDVLARVPVEGQ
jgi:hypothetical protein